jgi:hypothetical protein
VTEPGRPDAFLDEDDHTRLTRDAIAANAIARALCERFGYVRLSTRYSIACEAIAQARADAEPIQRSVREFESLSRDEQATAIVTTFHNSGVTLDEFLGGDPQ